MTLRFTLVRSKIDESFFSKQKLCPMPKSLGISSIIVENDVLNFVKTIDQRMCNRNLSIKVIFDDTVVQRLINTFEFIKKDSPSKIDFWTMLSRLIQ